MAYGNLLLDALAEGDLASLRPHLQKSTLNQQTILHEAGDNISRVYFPTSSIISLVVTLSTGQVVEAAMVGRDGVVGATAGLDGELSLVRAIVQLSGDCYSCDVASFKDLVLHRRAMLSLFIRHEQTVFAQAQQSTACIASHTVEERLCRWMLRSRDLAGSDNLAFTQEFLGEMLGVSRPTVSTVANTLQQAGLIKYSRGKIQITNLEGMRESSCECYGTIRKHYESLIGSYPTIT